MLVPVNRNEACFLQHNTAAAASLQLLPYPVARVAMDWIGREEEEEEKGLFELELASAAWPGILQPPFCVTMHKRFGSSLFKCSQITLPPLTTPAV
jgi:hypothetical protein